MLAKVIGCTKVILVDKIAELTSGIYNFPKIELPSIDLCM